MAEAQARGLGYLGWSWAGNNDPILDMTQNFNPAALTTWGQRIVNGTNGVKATGARPHLHGPPPVTSPPPARRRHHSSAHHAAGDHSPPTTPPVHDTAAGRPHLPRDVHHRQLVAGRVPGRGEGDRRDVGHHRLGGELDFANGQAITRSGVRSPPPAAPP
jgi:mannan endo-1,4-beta-mannosidase